MIQSVRQHQAMTLQRKRYTELIQACMLGGDKYMAQECAALAVKQGLWADPSQRPELYFPGLLAKPIHQAQDFSEVRHLERHADAILEEVKRITDPSRYGVTTVEEPLLHRGRWDAVIFYENGHRFDRACALFPETAKIIDQIPVEKLSSGVVMLSWLYPDSHIVPHCGYTNGRLRIHMGVQTPKDVLMRVKNELFTWEPGKCVVFDDSFEHEVWNTGKEPRIVLLFDIFHPEMSSEQTTQLLQEEGDLEEKIRKFMSMHGLKRVERNANGLVKVVPEGYLALKLQRFMWDANVASIELVDDKLEVEYLPYQRAAHNPKGHCGET